MNDGHLSRLHLLDLISDHKILATALWSDNNERIAFLEPRLDHGNISLDSDGFHNWWQILIFQIVDLDLSTSVRSKGHPVAS